MHLLFKNILSKQCTSDKFSLSIAPSPHHLLTNIHFSSPPVQLMHFVFKRLYKHSTFSSSHSVQTIILFPYCPKNAPSLQTSGHTMHLLVFKDIMSKHCTLSSNTWPPNTPSLQTPGHTMHLLFKHLTTQYTFSSNMIWPHSAPSLQTPGHTIHLLFKHLATQCTFSSNT